MDARDREWARPRRQMWVGEEPTRVGRSTDICGGEGTTQGRQRAVRTGAGRGGTWEAPDAVGEWGVGGRAWIRRGVLGISRSVVWFGGAVGTGETRTGG